MKFEWGSDKFIKINSVEAYQTCLCCVCTQYNTCCVTCVHTQHVFVAYITFIYENSFSNIHRLGYKIKCFKLI